MGKFKSTINEVRTDLTVTAMRLASGDFSVITRSDRILMIVITVLMAIYFASSAAFAATGDESVFTKIKTTFSDYYTNLVGIATVAAAVCIIAGLLWTMLSPSSRSSATPIAWIKKVLFCYFLIMVIGGIFKLIGDMKIDFDPGTYEP